LDVLFSAFFTYVVLRAYRCHQIGQALECELGFRYSRLHVPGDKSPPYNKLMIRKVEAGSVFEMTGFRAGDILDLADTSFRGSPSTALFKLLDRRRGDTVGLRVINIADIVDDETAFEAQPWRLVTLAIPPRVK
jgi:hypothetical protein